MNVLEEKQKAMNKKYSKILWNFTKEWFRLPKIIITFGSVFILYTLFSSQYGEYLFYGIQALLVIYLIVKGIRLHYVFKQRTKESNKKWMLEYMIFKTAYAGSFVYLVYVLRIHQAADNLQTSWVALLYSAFFILAFLVSYITLEVIPKQGQKLLEKTYPEYKMS